MKSTYGILWFVILYFHIVCKGNSSHTYETINEITIPSVEESLAIDSVKKAEEEIIKEAIPASVITKKVELREEKEDNSAFRKEGCCSSEPPPALCCCEPILIKYLEILKSEDVKEIAMIRSEDPMLNDCYKKIPSFKKKLDELEMGDE